MSCHCACFAFVGLSILYAIYLLLVLVFNRLTLKRCTSNVSLKGKTVIVTGATAGLGKSGAMDFAKRGARLILACRNIQKARRVAETIMICSNNEDVHVRHLDTSSLNSVRQFAKEIQETEKRLDILVLNAGILSPIKRRTSVDGIELTMATNHFGHFLLVNLLCGLLKRTSPSRIVVTASTAHVSRFDMDTEDLNLDKEDYNKYRPYSITKLCNVYMTRYLAQRLEGTGVSVNCFCPLFANTDIINSGESFLHRIFQASIPTPLKRSSEEGAQTLIYLAVDEEGSKISGEFFVDCKVRKSTPLSYNKEKMKRVWELSEKMVSLKEEEKSI